MADREDHENSEDYTDAYPTWQKIQQKEKEKKLKAEGKKPNAKKRKVVIEDHYDDCGSDLSGLGPLWRIT